MKKIHLTIEISDEVKEGSIGFYPNFWKGYISQVCQKSGCVTIAHDSKDDILMCKFHFDRHF